MSAHPSHGSRKEPSAAVRALVAGAAALVITGACLALSVHAAPGTVRRPLAWGGGAAAVVIIVAVAAAVYYLLAARRAQELQSAVALEADRVEREFAELAGETLPSVVRQAREGADAAAILAGTRVPATEVVGGLLDTVVTELASAERRAALATAERTRLLAEVTQLADETLPAVIRQLRDGESADVVLAGLTYPGNEALRDLLDTVAEDIAAAQRRGDAAMAACASAAARIQAQATRMLAELREMEHRHGGDEKVFADLMRLDHRVSQAGRLADSIALLAGGRSGRRWTRPIPMESLLRGAMGRIDAYQRIRVHSTSTVGVAGYAAEGVMHALAELMDNAASFSAHGSEVHVYVEEEDVGVLITIEDSGLGMRKRERSRAEDLVTHSLDLATLPGTRLGLAVVGRVAARYGLSVSFRPSSRGGTGVVVMIPRQLIAQPRQDAQIGPPGPGVGQPAPAAGTDPAGTDPAGAGPFSAGIPLAAGPGGSASAAGIPAGDGADPGAAGHGYGHGSPDELPVRPRGQTLAAADPAGRPAAAGSLPARPRDAGQRFAAFRESGGRSRNMSPAPGAGNAARTETEEEPDDHRGTGEG
jgi:signal transduction histidine kinase